MSPIKHPENFTDEELRKLLNDTKCLQACRDLLDGKEALARQNATAPDIEKEWSKFSSQHTTQKDIRHKGELNSPDGAPKGKTRNVDTFGRKLSVPAVKRMRFIGLSIVLIAASIALLFCGIIHFRLVCLYIIKIRKDVGSREKCPTFCYKFAE